MNNYDWQVGEAYKTRGGWKATVLSTNGPASYPIVVKHSLAEGDDIVRTHRANGAFWSNGRANESDLVPPKRENFEIYTQDGKFYASCRSKPKAIELAQLSKSNCKIIRFIEDGEVTDDH
jgi:hypothetical protein